MPRPRSRKILSFVLIAFAGMVVGVVLSFYVLLRLSVPTTDGSVSLPGVTGEIEITFDRMGIPQIWAENEKDALFALGYQHAADRMFQMDLSRRIASGRLSNLLGSGYYETDVEQRRVGHHRLARAAERNLSVEDRERLQAYVDGINTYATNCWALPWEYRFLPLKFEPWTTGDCLALLSFQTWFSNALMNPDEFHLRLIEKVGRAAAQSLMFSYPDWAPTTIGNGEVMKLGYRFDSIQPPSVRSVSPFLPLKSPARSLLRDGLAPFQMTHSSNAWVVAPSRSASGKSMLASDPHLPLTHLPQFWYAAGVHARDNSIDVLGITTPGLPFFVMGHNGRAAWAFTAGGVDVIDYAVKQINPEDSNQYLTTEGWREFEYISDTLGVSEDGHYNTLTFKRTQHGPVVPDYSNDTEVLTIHWAGFDVDLAEAVANGFELHGVDNFETFQRVVTGLGALDANMLYADTSGNIGYQLTTPLRSQDSVSALGPHAMNPRRGWLANCNNLPERSELVNGQFFANRILSITKLLESKNIFTVEDMQNFQMDRTDRYLLRFKDELARLLDSIDEPDRADSMRNWDGSTTVDSREAALMSVYLTELKSATFEDELEDLHGRVPARWIENIAAVDSAGWFDDVTTEGVVETYEDIAVGALEEALSTTNGMSWGDLQYLSMEHPMSMMPILGSLLDLSTGPIPWGGTAGTLNASLSRPTPDGKYESIAGPSWRFVIDLADIDAATMVLPAGNSGNPMSDHFMDFFEMWKSGERWTVPFTRDAVSERAVSTLVLKPALKTE